MSKKIISGDLAKVQLEAIDKILDDPHVLIGGLAVQQYHNPRISNDIDLICDSETAKRIIDKIYPTKDYKIEDKNDDEYRPAYIITNKIDDSKIIFFGPKIIEREPYNYLNLNELNKDSLAFRYKSKILNKIRVPCIERLAFSKLLSFLDRVQKSQQKGEQDLIDFINLSNQENFKINVFIDMIRRSECDKYIENQLFSLKNYNKELWNSSLICDFLKILAPIIDFPDMSNKLGHFDDNIDKIFTLKDSLEFYNLIAPNYDERNTRALLSTHKEIISIISKYLKTCDQCSILDMGCGTGRLIALHFFDETKLEWYGLDSSKEMLSQFNDNLRNCNINFKTYCDSIFSIPTELESKKFHIILISCVLTSLSHNPNFDSIIRLLHHGGILIIADIHPNTTSKKPFYDFEIGDQKIALTPRKVEPFDIISIIINSLELLHTKVIEDNDKEKYSYILHFTKR